MLQSLFQDIIQVSLTTSVVIGLLLLLLPLIHKNYSARWRYLVWLVLAVRLLIPYSPSLPQAPIEITPPEQQIAFQAPAQNTGAMPVVSQTSAPPVSEAQTGTAEAASTVTLEEILAAVWAGGIVLFLLYHLTGYLLFKRSVLRFARPAADSRILTIFRDVKAEMNVSRAIGLLTCKKVQSPMMTGFFRPVLLLPDWDYSDTELMLILKHELIHYQRRDIWYKLILIGTNAVHWFNPLVYLMTAVSNRDIEMACDSQLIGGASVAYRKRYSETILTAVHKGNRRQTVFSTYFYGGPKTMKERFSNIFDMRKKRRGILALCVIVLIIGLAGSSVAYGENGSIDNIALLKAGYSYGLDQGKFYISYGGNESATVPLTPDTENGTAYFADKAVYISDTVTAVAYGAHVQGGEEQKPSVSVLVTNDKGKTWNSYPVKAQQIAAYEEKYIGFTTPQDGWLILTGDVAMGHQENWVFTTADGGKNWHEIGNTSNIYARVVTGAGFANSHTGFFKLP